jgi:thiol peroxidase
MSTTAFKGEAVNTKGNFPVVGDKISGLNLTKTDLSSLTEEGLKGKKVVFNIFPSVDTGVCAMQLKTFSSKLKDREDVVLLFASLDLPFALSRFCGAEGIENAVTTSDFKHRCLENHGLLMTDGALNGLYARAVMVLDEEQNVIHSELVSDITIEPNYDEALKFI